MYVYSWLEEECFYTSRLKEGIYLEVKTESNRQLLPPNDREDMYLEIMVIGHFFLEDILSLKMK